MDFTGLIRDLVIAFLSFATAGWGGLAPEEVLVIGAGGWAAVHEDDYGPYRWLILPVIWAGVVFSDTLLYAAGRFYGERLLQFRLVAKLLPVEKRLRVALNFQRYGVAILLFGRIVPGIRLPLFMTAGMMRVSVLAFLISDFLGTFLGSSLVFFLAFWFGAQVMQAWEHEFNQYRPWFIMAIILAVVVYLLINFFRRPYRTGDPEEVPIIGHQVAIHIPTPPEVEEVRACPGRKPLRPEAESVEMGGAEGDPRFRETRTSKPDSPG